jgi:fructokinase
MANVPFIIAGLGEALYDVFPDHQVLGGAPLNMAVHAHQLGQPLGGTATVISRVGQDVLGRQIIAELAARGMGHHLQTDPDLSTGTVAVTVDTDGQPTYDIVRDVAWDAIQFDPDLKYLAQNCQGVTFGTLAQRVAQSRNTIYRFLDATRRAIRLFDVNLRQDYYDNRIIRRSCEFADAIKLNAEELPVVMRELGLSRIGAASDDVSGMCQALIDEFELRFVAYTRGERGTVLYRPGECYEDAAVSYPAADRANAVGAGDACAAALLIGAIKSWPPEKTVKTANHLGAYVASQPGATPTLPDELVDMANG